MARYDIVGKTAAQIAVALCNGAITIADFKKQVAARIEYYADKDRKVPYPTRHLLAIVGDEMAMNSDLKKKITRFSMGDYEGLPRPVSHGWVKPTQKAEKPKKTTTRRTQKAEPQKSQAAAAELDEAEVIKMLSAMGYEVKKPEPQKVDTRKMKAFLAARGWVVSKR